MDQPIIDPPTPYVGPINGGFTSGKMVRIQGYVSPVGQRIDINFQTSENTAPRDDIGLHLSIRLVEGYIARNSLQGGIWGEEQGHGDLPIQPGEKFEIIVLAADSEYKIAVNGKHYCEFPQRLPTSSVTHLSIDGDVSLSLLSFEIVPLSAGPDVSSSAPPPNQSFGPPPNQSFGPPNNQSFGPPTNQSFGPPSESYGGFGNQGPYGPQPGQYPPPPPPGQQKESGFDSFMESAGPLIAGAISSGVAANLLSSITGSGAGAGGTPNQQQQQHQQPPYVAPQQQQQQPAQSGAPDVLGSLGSLLSSFTGGQNQQQQYQQPQQYQQQPAQSGGQDALGGLGTLLSSFTGQQNQPQQQPAPGGTQDALGGLGSLLSSFTHSQPQPQQQPQAPFNLNQVGGQGSVGGLGSVGSLLTSLAGQVLTPQSQPQPRDQNH